MSTFLDKNKKKSALAALLLFLRTRKTVTALLLLVALASFLFVSPSNFILSFPGGARVAAGVAWIAGKVGVDTSKWGLAGGKRDYGDLLAAFHAAKEGGGKAGWAAFMRGGNGSDEAGRIAAGSAGSLGFVQGSAKDLEASGGNGANLPKSGSVDGVLNPDDAKNRAEGEGVALSQGDVTGEREGMVKSAFAGGFANGVGGGAGGGEGMLSGGAFANSNFFGNGSGSSSGGGGRSAISGKLSDVVNGGLEGIKGQTAKGVQIQGAAKGQINASKANTIDARTSRGLVGTHTISGQRAFVQLAAGRSRALISVSPNCTAGSGCPGEFATTNTGAVYDGNTITGDRTDILTAPQIDNISTPNLPDTGMADQYVKDAEKMQADADKCHALDVQYAPQELAFDQQQQAESDQFSQMDCGEGGCSRAKADACQRFGDQMKATCRSAMTVRCEHIHACPLTASNDCSPAECDGAARQKDKITVNNGGINSTTMDQGEASAGCADSKQNIITARQSAQNAIDAYRGNSCEALRSDVTLTGKLKYLNTCSGPESQVVTTCQNYAQSLCTSAHTCSNTECSGSTDACVITDLNGIQDFINK